MAVNMHARSPLSICVEDCIFALSALKLAASSLGGGQDPHGHEGRPSPLNRKIMRKRAYGPGIGFGTRCARAIARAVSADSLSSGAAARAGTGGRDVRPRDESSHSPLLVDLPPIPVAEYFMMP